MSLNASVQHLGSGAATVLAGYMIVERPDKSLVGFSLVGLVACAATAASIVLAGRLRPAAGGLRAPDEAEVELEPAAVGVH
jgi:hypothetical protein